MLELQNLGKTYPNGFTALDDINVHIQQGERIAIVGSSGCGKSTLLRLIAGLCPPSSGQVCIDGEPVREPNPKVGFIFQEPRLMPWLQVRENVAFGLPRSCNDRNSRVLDALRRVGLESYGTFYPKQLSGGMAQRVAIARALATSPEILLLDEPFSALDAIKRTELQDHVVNLWSEQRITTIIVTHDVEEAIVLADRVLVMHPYPGRILRDLAVDLPLQRDRESERFQDLRKVLLADLHPNSSQPERTYH